VPILSVITVVKDDPAGLQNTLDSMSQQERVDPTQLQFVVIDGSSPSLEDLVTDSGMTNVSYIWQKPQGIFNAMNYGISHAQGDYVLFLNAGDTLFDTRVLKQLIDFLQASSPIWAYGRVQFTSPSGQDLTEPEWSYTAERSRFFARGLFPSHQGTVMRLNLMNSLGGFDETYQITSDYHLMLKASKESQPDFIPFPIARFQQGGASTQNWRTAVVEFHRARTSVFNPRGFKRLQEWTDTAVGFAKSSLAPVKAGLHVDR
jgi:putative colanic acid biosynthesis glycosyltransferase